MCGIFGLVVYKDAPYDHAFITKSLKMLAQLSETRGKDSSGLAVRNECDRRFCVFKGAVHLKYLLKRKEVVREIDRILASSYHHRKGNRQNTFAVIGHSRLVTNGSQLNNVNNQPIVKDGVIGVHNGIIVNQEELWSQHPEMQKAYEIDTEVMLALIKKYIGAGWDFATAMSKTVKDIFGTVAAAFFIHDLDLLGITTNNGSLYALSDEIGLFAFASEEYFLRTLANKMHLDINQTAWIRQVAPGKGYVLDLEEFRLEEFSFSTEQRRCLVHARQNSSYPIEVQSVPGGKSQRDLTLDCSKIMAHPSALLEAGLLEFNMERILELRRCAKCILPETFPHIAFDEHGICNYCKNYIIKNQPKPIEQLLDLVKPYRRCKGGYECIVPYSGGRDSTFTLHNVKRVLRLNPVALTYDWGMVNDLARRNIARVCGKLGVENIIVSADISWKRENIRKNVLAWLKKPHLGMVPLFMAGDKFFYYYTDQVKKQTGVRLNIWGVNPLENTEFKVGFLGVPPDHGKKWIYSLSGKRQIRLFFSVGKIILENPSYLNRSIWNTMGGFISRSIVAHRDYHHLFDYYPWDEGEVEKLVREEYQWETAVDTPTTWRIGDGTAPFYNYIYYTVAGFSEYDTFRSNQIREGVLDREEALKLVMIENRPRYPSLKWYTEILGLDFSSTVKRINSIPKLYP